MTDLIQEVARALQQRSSHSGASCTRLCDVMPDNMMSEEQWIEFVLSRRGIDHLNNFFLTNFDREVLQWFVNKPLARSSTSTTLLHLETRDRRHAVLSLLLKFGGSPNVTDANLQTPVHFAVINVNTSCLQTLLEWGGDLYQQDEDGKSPMDYMTISSPVSFGLTIKQHCGFQDIDNDLNYIAQLQSIILGKEVDKSFDEFRSVYSLLSPHQRTLCMRLEVSNQTLLYRACKAGWTDIVSFLLSQMDQIPPANTTTNETPLHAACEGNHYDIVVELINKFPELLLMRDKLPYRGWYPIHTVCAFGASDKILAEVLIGTMKLCIDFPHKFTNITFTDLCGQSPLYIAVACGNLSHVSMYLHPLLVETFLQVAPSLVAVNTSNIPTKCSVIHTAVLGDYREILGTLLNRFPLATMGMAYPCKVTVGVLLEQFGHCLNSYSQLPKICERSNGELAVVPYEQVSVMDKPFNELSLSPLVVGCALGRTEIVTKLLDAGGIKTDLALQVALFTKHDDIVVNLLFHQQHEKVKFLADGKNLVHFPASDFTLRHVFQCTEIDLQRNSLVTIPLALFQTPLLKHLNVSFNKLSTLPIGLKDEKLIGIAKWGWNCLSLETLNLESNAISSLPEFIWELPKLQWLNVSHNCLAQIPCATNYNTQLHSLKVDFSHNRLKEVPSIIMDFQDVDLTFNQLVSLPMNLWKSKIIKKLDVSHNSISELGFPGELSSSKHLDASVHFANSSGNISSNESYVNTEQLDSVCSLTKFNISHNHLNGFPTDLSCFVTHLQHLDVSFNQIGDLDIQFLPPYLRGLNAQKSNILKFGVITDDAKRNTIKKYCTFSVPGSNCPHKTHTSLPHLSFLNLAGNKLQDIQFVSPSSKDLLYPELKSLDLSSNDLHGNFSEDIKLQSCLCRLNLRDNPKLESIPAQLSLLSESLFELQLANLPQLSNPPSEYHTMPTQRILSYLRLQLETLVEYSCLRIMVFGYSKTGKSTLINRLVKRKTRVSQRTTPNHSKIEWAYAPSSSIKPVKFIIWDFNQDVIQATHHCFYSKRAFYLVVFNLVDDEKGVQELDTILKNIQVHAPGCPVILVGTHLDQVNVKKLSGLKELVDELYGDSSIYPIIAAVTFVSSTAQKLKVDSAINKLRKEIYFVASHMFLINAKTVYQPSKSPEDSNALLQQMIPESFLDLEQDIITKAAEMRVSNNIPVITVTDFCSSFMPVCNSENDLKEAFEFLRDQGTILYYSDYWKRQIFCIDLEWFCDVVGKIVTIPVNNGIVPKKLFFQWCRPFLSSHHNESLELFAAYDIIIDLGESSCFVPSLLPESSTVLGTNDTLVCTTANSSTTPRGAENHSTEASCSIDDEYSSDDNDDDDYVKSLVDRVLKHGHCKLANQKGLTSNSNLLHLNQQSATNSCNFYNINLMKSSYFEKSTDLLTPYVSRKVYYSIPKVKDIADASFYPPLCRFWFSRFIPSGFWQRLQSRIVSGVEIKNVLLKLLPIIQHHSLHSLWNLWQSGIAIVYKKTTLLELKHEANFTLGDNQKLVLRYGDHRIILSINTAELIFLHETNVKADCRLSCEMVLSLTTKLLVLIEQLILELDTWFPRTLQINPSGEVTSYVPCYRCIQDAKVNLYFNYTEHVMIYLNGYSNNIFCFSFKKLLDLYSTGKTPTCHHHGRFFVELCAPDIAFKDVQHVVCGPDIPINIDKDKVLGRGGYALVLRGEMMKPRQLVAIKAMMSSQAETTTVTDYFDNYAVSLKNYQTIRKEVSFLSTLHHDNLTQLCGVSTSPFLLLIELAPLGSLRTIIKEYRVADTVLASPVLCQSMTQMASALSFLHQKHVIYFDLKSDNILVWKFPLPTSSKTNQTVLLKITDYGISRVSTSGYEIRTNNVDGTPGYIAPEVLLGRNILQADKIDVFSYGMTVYELISLQMPFEKLCKINPDVNINTYVTKKRRPPLPLKGIWSPYLVQNIMNLCWEHDPNNRPKMSQVVEWCNLPEVEVLRAVYHLENGTLSAICQCQIDHTHIHSLDVDSVDTSKVKFTITPYTEDDPLLSFPVPSSPNQHPLLPLTPFEKCKDENENFNFRVETSNLHSQLWIVQLIDEHASELQIFSYNNSQAGYRMYSTSIYTTKVSAMVDVGQYMWIYTADHKLNVVHISTMQNIACFLLETKLSAIELLHVPEWQVVIVLWRKSQLWFIHDKIKDGLHVMDVIKLDKRDPVIHMCVVNLSERTEVWATQGDRKIVIFETSSNGFWNSDTLLCTVENRSLFASLIVCLCFTSTVSGNNMVHVWVSFNQQPYLVCWDAKKRIQINCIKTNTGYDVTSLLGHQNQLYVGTSSGLVEVHDSEKGVILQQYSLHVSAIHRIIKLPPEIHKCICAELFPTVKSNTELSNISDHVGSRSADKDEDVIPKERSLQEHALQQSSSPCLPHLSYSAPLIVSIGDGLANWLNADGKERMADHNLELLTWTGYGHLS